MSLVVLAAFTSGNNNNAPLWGYRDYMNYKDKPIADVSDHPGFWWWLIIELIIVISSVLFFKNGEYSAGVAALILAEVRHINSKLK